MNSFSFTFSSKIRDKNTFDLVLGGGGGQRYGINRYMGTFLIYTENF